MSRGRTSRVPNVPQRALQRFTPQGDAALLREIEASADRGMVVIVRRGQGPAFSIVRNDTNLLVRPHPLWDRQPVGTYHDAADALRAGDRWVDAVNRGEFDDEDDGGWPRGAA